MTIIRATLTGYLGVFLGDHKNGGTEEEGSQIRGVCSWIFVLFAGPTEMWQSAIDSFLIFLIFF